MSSISKTAPTKRGGWRRIAILIVGVLTFGLIPLAGSAVAPEASPVMAPAPAHAGDWCSNTGGVICGRVFNSPHSNVKVNVHDGWTNNDGVPAGRVIQVAPGHWSTFRDTDGYCLPPYTKARVWIKSPFRGDVTRNYSPVSGWRCQKINDDQTAYVLIVDKKADIAKKRAAELARVAALIKAQQIKSCKALVKKAKSKAYAKKNAKALKFCASKYGIKK